MKIVRVEDEYDGFIAFCRKRGIDVASEYRPQIYHVWDFDNHNLGLEYLQYRINEELSNGFILIGFYEKSLVFAPPESLLPQDAVRIKLLDLEREVAEEYQAMAQYMPF